MAWWDSRQGKIVRFPPRPIEGYPGWKRVDCGCCAGLEWGGEHPRECEDCGGNGTLCWHEKSGVLADYPGGPLRGRTTNP